MSARAARPSTQRSAQKREGKRNERGEKGVVDLLKEGSLRKVSSGCLHFLSEMGSWEKQEDGGVVDLKIGEKL